MELEIYQLLYQEFKQYFYHPLFIKLRDALFIYLVINLIYDNLKVIYHRGLEVYLKKIKNIIKQKVLDVSLSIPFLKEKVHHKLSIQYKALEEAGVLKYDGQKVLQVLPNEGWSEQEVIQSLQSYDKMGDKKWQQGYASGSVYRPSSGEDEVILTEVMKLYGLSNILHPDMFPSVNKMEREIVNFCLELFNAPTESAGCFSMGGTESILLACRTYKERAKAERNITKPQMIVPISAHAAFDKACEYFEIELVHIPLDENFQVDLKKVERAINSNTIMLVGSCMNFPHGIIDDIPSLSKLAVKYNVGLHVDCCLGGFLVPFMSDSSFGLPIFDFRLPGVTSISCDTHKYGCTIKGSSVVLYRSADLFSNQFSIYPEWLGGIYATHSIQGSRPGILVAATWAALVHRGKAYYLQQAKQVVGTAQHIKKLCANLDHLQVVGDPKVSVIAFQARHGSSINPLNVADAMQTRGWTLNKLQHPLAFHLGCTARTIGLAETFVNDLKDAINDVVQNPKNFEFGTTPLYGAKVQLEGTNVSSKLIKAYLKGLLKH